jgi:hypothetical protein
MRFLLLHLRFVLLKFCVMKCLQSKKTTSDLYAVVTAYYPLSRCFPPQPLPGCVFQCSFTSTGISGIASSAQGVGGQNSLAVRAQMEAHYFRRGAAAAGQIVPPASTGMTFLALHATRAVRMPHTCVLMSKSERSSLSFLKHFIVQEFNPKMKKIIVDFNIGPFPVRKIPLISNSTNEDFQTVSRVAVACDAHGAEFL